jgi:hypothetical protein
MELNLKALQEEMDRIQEQHLTNGKEEIRMKMMDSFAPYSRSVHIEKENLENIKMELNELQHTTREIKASIK